MDHYSRALVFPEFQFQRDADSHGGVRLPLLQVSTEAFKAQHTQILCYLAPLHSWALS